MFFPLNQNWPCGQFEMHSTKTTVRRGLFEVENIFSNRNYDSMWHSDSFSAFCFFAFLVIYWKKRTLSCFLLIIYVQIRWFDVECKSERLNIHSFVKKIAVGHWPTSLLFLQKLYKSTTTCNLTLSKTENFVTSSLWKSQMNFAANFKKNVPGRQWKIERTNASG